jgi:hypothetical protein
LPNDTAKRLKLQRAFHLTFTVIFFASFMAVLGYIKFNYSNYRNLN